MNISIKSNPLNKYKVKMLENYIGIHSKDFEIECLQIQYWYNSLSDVKSQIESFKSIVESEARTYETLGKSLYTLAKGYLNDVSIYSEEPSQLFKLTKNFSSIIETAGKFYSEDILLLNVEINKHIPMIIEDINSLIQNILSTSNSMMTEVSELRKSSKNVQNKYSKLKAELDSAHINKKKLDNDPKSAYNVTLKEKAEKKILDSLKEMQEMRPTIESCAKKLDDKKELFNKNMKDTFELVIMNVFKNIMKIQQTFFLVSKEKYDMYTKMKNFFNDEIKIISNNDIRINDYVERKFAEKNGTIFESLDSINLTDENFISNPLNLINACTSVNAYSLTFYNCMKYRKRLMQVLLKFLTEIAKCEDSLCFNNSKVSKQLSNLVGTFEFIGPGTSKCWSILGTMFSVNQHLHGGLNKYVATSTTSIVINFIKECKSDYTTFLSNWTKYSKEISALQANYQKVENSREKIQKQIQQLRTTDSNSQSKSQGKLDSLRQEENSIRGAMEENGKKLKNYLIIGVDFLKKNVKFLREKEYKRIKGIVDSLAMIGRIYEKISDENIELSKGEIENTTTVDIFEESKQIFVKYFDQFKIQNYEAYMERIKVKILKKTDFESDNIGKSTFEILAGYNAFNQTFKTVKSEFKRITDNPMKLGADNINIHRVNDNQSDISPIYYSSRSNLKVMENIKEKEVIINNMQSNGIVNHPNNNHEQYLKSEAAEPNKEETDSPLKKETSQHASSEDDNISNQKKLGNTQHSITSVDEEMDFVNKENFNLIDKNHKNPYQNIKENDLREYMAKLSTNKVIGAYQEIPGEIEDKGDGKKHGVMFNLETDEIVLDSFSCAYSDSILLQGKLYVTTKKLVFYSWFNPSTLFGSTKLVIPLEDVVSVKKKANLKIFDNSIEIKTNKSSLFFTSFIFRDHCYSLIAEHAEQFQKRQSPGEDGNREGVIEQEDVRKLEENPQVEQKAIVNNAQSLKLQRNNYFNSILKRMNFFEQLDHIHKNRVVEFEALSTNDTFLKESVFKQVYFVDDSFSNCPLPLIYNTIFNPSVINEDFNLNKTFWESSYLIRNDINISFTENTTDPVPKFFEDMDYYTSLLTNFEQDSLQQFLDEIKDWTKIRKYTYFLTHPIKKKFIGPDKITLREEYTLYFISPKMFIIEIQSFGIGFPFSDSFVSITQYRFKSNYKYSLNEGHIKVSTTCNLLFHILWKKSCLFRSKIDSEGYKESEENLKYNTYEKVKTIIENQNVIFNQMFAKLNEENIRKTINKFNSGQGAQLQNDENLNQMVEMDSSFDEENNPSNRNDKFGWKIVKDVVTVHYESTCENSKTIKPNLVRNSYFITIIGLIILWIIFNKVQISFSTISEKLFNIVILGAIGILFSKYFTLK